MTSTGDNRDPETPATRERRSRHRREHAARRPPGTVTPRIRAGHRVFFHEDGQPLFGPGTYDLLVLVNETGSLHQAAKTMGMSYSKAWRAMHEAEEHLGLELLRRRTGGSAGGGSALTEHGHELVRRFRAFIDEADAELDRLYRKHFGDEPFAQPDSSSAPEDAPLSP